MLPNVKAFRVICYFTWFVCFPQITKSQSNRNNLLPIAIQEEVQFLNGFNASFRYSTSSSSFIPDLWNALVEEGKAQNDDLSAAFVQFTDHPFPGAELRHTQLSFFFSGVYDHLPYECIISFSTAIDTLNHIPGSVTYNWLRIVGYIHFPETCEAYEVRRYTCFDTATSFREKTGQWLLWKTNLWEADYTYLETTTPHGKATASMAIADHKAGIALEGPWRNPVEVMMLDLNGTQVASHTAADGNFIPLSVLSASSPPIIKVLHISDGVHQCSLKWLPSH